MKQLSVLLLLAVSISVQSQATLASTAMHNITLELDAYEYDYQDDGRNMLHALVVPDWYGFSTVKHKINVMVNKYHNVRYDAVWKWDQAANNYVCGLNVAGLHLTVAYAEELSLVMVVYDKIQGQRKYY